jgi:hypothetical protein
MKSIIYVIKFAVTFAIVAVLAGLAFALFKAPIVFGVLLISGATILFVKIAGAVGLIVGAVLGAFLNIFRKEDGEELVEATAEVYEVKKAA